MGKADFKPCRKLSFDARQSDKDFVLTPKQSFERALCISRCERHPPLEGRDIVLCPMRVFLYRKRVVSRGRSPRLFAEIRHFLFSPKIQSTELRKAL